MSLITLVEAKNYLRLDTDDDDTLVQSLLDAAERLAIDVSRLSDTEWALLDDTTKTTDPDGNLTGSEISAFRAVLKAAFFYTLGYLYEHREEADHKALTMTLRSILFSIREGRPRS
ncbi:MAG: phage gp6-like head-tail connector protein [bacterium LCO1.1]|jgi:hypothetical protein|uniref:Phage gp6-like head-tail connector protein n=1 Tax=Candidatus Weimeria bifida TaxID=2599074 RepID=A0A6N7IW30_9FIRM|nr:phage gp6-like head-tail connector protein [Candidatus Weimeria bifida]